MVNRKQELGALRRQIDSIHDSIRKIRTFESDPSYLTNREIVNHIKYLEAAKARLTIDSRSIEGKGGQVPAKVLEALQAADEELRNIVQGYQDRNTMITDAIGGSARIQDIRRLDVGRNPNQRIQDYLRLHPDIPGGVDDYLLSEETTNNSFQQQRFTDTSYQTRSKSPMKQEPFQFTTRTDTSYQTTNKDAIKQEPFQFTSRTSRDRNQQTVVEPHPNNEIINIDDDVFHPDIPAPLLYVRGVLNPFPNWSLALQRTKAQRNPQDSSDSASLIAEGEERYLQKLFMIERMAYWITNRQTYTMRQSASTLRGRFAQYFSNDDNEVLQKLRFERASALIGQYDPYLPEGVLLNEPFLYFANVDRTFDEERPFIDRTSRALLTEAQVRNRLQLIDNEPKAMRILDETGLVPPQEINNPLTYIID
jgi:hypothetical protein